MHVSVGYKGPILAKHVIENKVSSIINTEGKGNCWWIYNSIFKLLNKPLFVLTCDNVTNINFIKIEKDYLKLGKPVCMLIPVHPISGLHGDFIFRKKNIVQKLSRTQKSNIYCTGKLYLSNYMPSKWFTVDKVNDLKRLRYLKN